MAFTYYKTTNNAQSTLAAGLTGSNLDVTIILKPWEGALYPSTYPFLLCLEKVDTTSTSIPKPVVRREIVKVTNRSSDTLTVVRASGTCVWDDTANPKTQGNTIYVFDVGDKVSLYKMSEDETDVKDEVARLETAKANDNVVVKLTGDQTVWGVKTFSSSPIVPTPTTDMQATTKKYVDDSIVASGLQESLGTGDFIAGEDVTQWDSLFLESQETFANATTVQNIWDVTGNTRVSIKQFWSGVAWSTLKLSLKKFIAPSVGLVVRVETDNAWSPSGTLVDANATANITAASLTTSLADTTVTFAGSFTVARWTPCHIVLAQAGDVVDGTNYYWFGYSTRNTTTRGYKVFDWTYRNKSPTTSDWINTDRLYGVTVTNASWTLECGIRIQTSDYFYISKIAKFTSCTATTAYIRSDADVLLATATFSWNIATLSSPLQLLPSTYYKITADSWGSTYTYGRDNVYAFPLASHKHSVVNWLLWVTTTDWMNIYYITTQDQLFWNWTITQLYPYVLSWLFEKMLLSKTDADYSYKYNTFWISKETKVWWSICKVDIKWISTNHSWLTENKVYYVWSVPWTLSLTPSLWFIWKSVSDTSIRMKEIDDIQTVVSWTSIWKTTQLSFTSSWSWTTVEKVATFKPTVKWSFKFSVYVQRVWGTNWGTGTLYRNWVSVWSFVYNNVGSPFEYTLSTNIECQFWDIFELYHTNGWGFQIQYLEARRYFDNFNENSTFLF